MGHVRERSALPLLSVRRILVGHGGQARRLHRGRPCQGRCGRRRCPRLVRRSGAVPGAGFPSRTGAASGRWRRGGVRTRALAVRSRGRRHGRALPGLAGPRGRAAAFRLRRARRMCPDAHGGSAGLGPPYGLPGRVVGGRVARDTRSTRYGELASAIRRDRARRPIRRRTRPGPVRHRGPSRTTRQSQPAVMRRVSSTELLDIGHADARVRLRRGVRVYAGHRDMDARAGARHVSPWLQ